MNNTVHKPLWNKDPQFPIKMKYIGLNTIGANEFNIYKKTLGDHHHFHTSAYIYTEVTLKVQTF